MECDMPGWSLQTADASFVPSTLVERKEKKVGPVARFMYSHVKRRKVKGRAADLG